MKSSIDALNPETPDKREWFLYGWAFHPDVAPSHGVILHEGREIGPVSCGWPRPDVIQALPDAPSVDTGYKAHLIIPPDIPAGTLKLDIIWKNAAGETLGSRAIEVAVDAPECPAGPDSPEPAVTPGNDYLDLIERALTGALFLDDERHANLRRDGRDWPETAHTMIGMARLHHLRACVETAIRENIPGDLIETGVWKGGACILMRAVLKSLGIHNRTVWVADSFRGLPPPQEELYPADRGDNHHTFEELAISRERVASHFDRYGLLDGQVRFLEGWFRDTLPANPAGPLAVIRLDGDMYESTMDALVHLYPRLSPGGYCIIDDYGCIEACRMAVRDYRKQHGISAPVHMIDWTGAWWRKP